MPRKPRRLVERRNLTDQLTADIECQLLWCRLDAMSDLSFEDKKRLWRLHGKTLSDKFCPDHPGRMPDGWWVSRPGGTERGFFEFRADHETEFETIRRLNWLEDARKSGMVEPKSAKGDPKTAINSPSADGP